VSALTRFVLAPPDGGLPAHRDETVLLSPPPIVQRRLIARLARRAP
jgi:hypothetical protein